MCLSNSSTCVQPLPLFKEPILSLIYREDYQVRSLSLAESKLWILYPKYFFSPDLKERHRHCLSICKKLFRPNWNYINCKLNLPTPPKKREIQKKEIIREAKIDVPPLFLVVFMIIMPVVISKSCLVWNFLSTLSWLSVYPYEKLNLCLHNCLVLYFIIKKY